MFSFLYLFKYVCICANVEVFILWMCLHVCRCVLGAFERCACV